MARTDDSWTHGAGALFARYRDRLADFPTLLGAVATVLASLIPCDEVLWNGVDRNNGRAIVYDAAGLYEDSDVHQLLLVLDDHPMVIHYTDASAGSDAGPTRLSDLTSDRQFRNTRTWSELFEPRGVRRQLTIPTTLNHEAAAGTGWSLNRYLSDFSDDELRLADRLQPLLAILESSDRWLPDPEDAIFLGDWGPWADRAARPADSPREAIVSPKLTKRELEVLRLLAQGLTAVSIGLRLRISPGTVRKHLEHIYEKTGYRDRLLAVEYAKRSGLLAP